MKSSSVTMIVEYKNRDIIQTCENLLAQAEAGEIQGLMFVTMADDDEHGIGMVGKYKQMPHEGLAGLGKLISVIKKLIGFDSQSGSRNNPAPMSIGPKPASR